MGKYAGMILMIGWAGLMSALIKLSADAAAGWK